MKNNNKDNTATVVSSNSAGSDSNTNTEHSTDGNMSNISHHSCIDSGGGPNTGKKGMPPLVPAGQGLALIVEESTTTSTMKPQTGSINNIVVLCPKVNIYNHFLKRLM